VEEALKAGLVVLKISSDHMTHPESFIKIASHLQGKILTMIQTKFTDIAMSALVACPPDATHIEEMCSAPFALDENGLFYALRVKATRV
jgi:hypothetical protein